MSRAETLPWEAVGNLVRTRLWTDERGRIHGGLLVAECPVHSETRVEDARLIAAAPSLLAALEAVVEHLSGECFDWLPARVAIAKARGEAA